MSRQGLFYIVAHFFLAFVNCLSTFYCNSYTTANTAFATQNTVICTFTACDQLTITNCDREPMATCSGDTIIRLRDKNGKEVATNDDYCGTCSRLSYETPGCQSYTLIQGCYGMSSCGGAFVVYSGLSPTLQPTPRFYNCPAFFASNTDYATVNTVSCSIYACNTIAVTNCLDVDGASCVGDTILKLFDGSGALVARGDDECGYCSRLEYTSFVCQTYTLVQGCYSMTSCSGQNVVSVRVPEPTGQPSRQPSRQPSSQPSAQPNLFPTGQPSNQPILIPTLQPFSRPSLQPSKQPSNQPSSQPFLVPTSIPSSAPITYSSSFPTGQPTKLPTRMPSQQPSCQPSSRPTNQPKEFPTTQPTKQPNYCPTSQPSIQPSIQPLGFPSCQPSAQPSRQPSRQPSSAPSRQPSRQPSRLPTNQPSAQPSTQPSNQPSRQPSKQPDMIPSVQPTALPTIIPSSQPSLQPSSVPSSQPSSPPTRQPSNQPSIHPTRQPTRQPSRTPTQQPTRQPSQQPSIQPTSQPTSQPSGLPSHQPISNPSRQPTSHPSGGPSEAPSTQPTAQPRGDPTTQPSSQPSNFPSIIPSMLPTCQPSATPSSKPSIQPSIVPTSPPSQTPSAVPSMIPSKQPSSQPSVGPSYQPSSAPSIQPSSKPSCVPSILPSSGPTPGPSKQPSSQPSSLPTTQPSASPSQQPSDQPSSVPSKQPSCQPTCYPTTVPSSSPSQQPSLQPSHQPSFKPSRQPSSCPSGSPTCRPSHLPSSQPTNRPSMQPSSNPSYQPSSSPSNQPSSLPSFQPTSIPSRIPSFQPSQQPSQQPSISPSLCPSSSPSTLPSEQPSIIPSSGPTSVPSMSPTIQPTNAPSCQPSRHPSVQPRSLPSSIPSKQPTTLPSNSPSMQPSQQPTSSPSRFPSQQPSQRPSGLPTTQPTFKPSCQPTPSPSRQPQANPSIQPTNHPSIRPTNLPSSNPTLQPSTIPTRIPTRQPSRQPSGIPSISPTYQPSTSPSRKPSSLPSKYPTVIPSGLPSVGPSNFPSSQPTYQPSVGPSNQPTNLPTAQPSQQPSSGPSQKPSSQPTGHPSEQPSAQPTRQPSALPSRLPSAQPSSSPSTRPTTSVPTSCPTGSPSFPSSAIVNSLPSSHPTSTPTVSIFEYRDRFKWRYLNSSHLRNESSVTFGSFYFKRKTIDGDCNDWDHFIKANLSLPFHHARFTQISATFENYDWNKGKNRNISVYCDWEMPIKNIIRALQTGEAYEYNCRGESWRVFTCQSRQIFCVNCKLGCQESIACPGRAFIINPCHSNSCGRYVASGVIRFEYEVTRKSDIGFPLIDLHSLSLTVITANATNFSGERILGLNISLQITAPGYVSCGAFLSTLHISDLAMIMSESSTSIATTSGVISLSIENDLLPETDYTVYCFTRDFSSQSMSLDEALMANKTIRTPSCCKWIQLTTNAYLTTTSKWILRPSEVTIIDVNIYNHELSLMQNRSSSIVFSLFPRFCGGSLSSHDVQDRVAAFMEPSIISIANLSLTTVVLFTNVSNECFTLRASVSISSNRDAYNMQFLDAEVDIDVKDISSASSIIRLPDISSCFFSPDGVKILVTFDMDTNRPNLANCFELLSFPGVLSSTCYWSTPRVLTIKLSDSIFEVKPFPNDTIQLRGGILKADCSNYYDCSKIQYVGNIVVFISAPPTKLAIHPKVSLVSSGLISYCDDIIIDPTSSSGSAGRIWKSVDWRVHASVDPTGMGRVIDAVAIETYLNSKYDSSSHMTVAVIPNRYLVSGMELCITLTLQNFFGFLGKATVCIIISDSIIPFIPRVTITAPSTPMASGILFSNPLAEVVLLAHADLPNCSQADRSLSFIWKVYKGARFMAELQSESPNRQIFRLSSDRFEHFSTYTIQVIVSVIPVSRNQTFLPAYSSSASHTFQYFPAETAKELTIDISGGQKQLKSASQGLRFDSETNAHGLIQSYSWSCSGIDPIVPNCPGFPIIQQKDLSSLEIPPYAMNPGVYLVRVVATYRLKNLSIVSLKAVIELRLISDLIPQIQWSSQHLRLNLQEKAIISAFIEIDDKLIPTLPILRIQWSCTEIPQPVLSSKLLTETSHKLNLNMQPTSNGVSRRILEQIVLPPFSFDSKFGDRVYTFRLAVILPNGFSAQSEIQFSINLPPFGGALVITPDRGIALETLFRWQTSMWIDDIQDYPLSYSMVYSSSNYTSLIDIKSTSLDAYTETYLSGGSIESGFLTMCWVTAFDVFGASANTSEEIMVTARVIANYQDYTEWNTRILSLLLQAEKRRIPQKILQVINIVTDTLNRGNNSETRLCALLHREGPRRKLHTCGPCIKGYEALGSTEAACWKLPFENSISLSLKPTGAKCTAGSQDACVFGSCNLGICLESTKHCANNCNGIGDCHYRDSSGGIIGSCLESSMNCKSFCQCSDEFLGDDCSIHKSSINFVLNTIRNDLCDSILFMVRNQDTSIGNSIESTVRSIGNIILYSSDNTGEGLTSCTAAIREAYDSHQSSQSTIVGDTSLLAGNVLDVLSSILSRDVGISSIVTRNSVVDIMAALSTICSNKLALEERIAHISEYLRFSAIAIDPQVYFLSSQVNNPRSLYFSAPSTEMEKIQGSHLSHGIMNFIKSDDRISEYPVSVAVVEIFNQYSLESSNAPNMIISIRDYLPSTNVEADKTRRRLSSKVADVTLTVYNYQSVHYEYLPVTKQIIDCQLSSSPYVVNGSCPFGLMEPFSVACSGLRGSYEINCPGRKSIPRCSIWSPVINKYEESDMCRTISYDALSTVCQCSLTVGPYQEAFDTVYDISVITVQVHFPYIEKLVDPFLIPPLSYDFAIVSVLGAVLFLFLIATGINHYRHSKTDEKFMKSAKRNNSAPVELFQSFISIPVDVTSCESTIVSRLRQLRQLMLIDHHWFRLAQIIWMSAFNPTRIQDIHASLEVIMKSVFVLCHVLVYLSVNTAVVFMVYPDDGTCEALPDMISCNNYRMEMLDDFYRHPYLCSWQVSEKYCSFIDPVNHGFVAVIVLTISITLLAIPMDKFMQFLIEHVKFHLANPKRTTSTIDSVDMDMQGNLTESVQLEDRKSKLLKAARLKILQSTDFISVKEEAIVLELKLELDAQKNGRRTLLFDTDSWSGLEVEESKSSAHSKIFNESISSQFPTDTTQHVRFARFQYTENSLSLIQQLDSARRNALSLKAYLDSMHHDNARDEYLLKRFLTFNYNGWESQIVTRYLFGKVIIDPLKDGSRIKICLVLFPMFLIGMISVIMVFVFLNGSRGSSFWGLIASISLLKNILILQPTALWIQWIFLSKPVLADLTRMTNGLRNRFRSIMNRQAGTGIIRDAHSLVQHLNPACRAARFFPSLPASRFLLSLNDYDVPLFIVPVLTCRKVGIVQILNLHLFSLWGNLPSLVQDFFLEVAVLLAINLPLIALYYLGKEVHSAAVIVLLSMAALHVRYSGWINATNERMRKYFGLNTSDSYAIPHRTSSTFKSRMVGDDDENILAFIKDNRKKFRTKISRTILKERIKIVPSDLSQTMQSQTQAGRKAHDNQRFNKPIRPLSGHSYRQRQAQEFAVFNAERDLQAKLMIDEQNDRNSPTIVRDDGNSHLILSGATKVTRPISVPIKKSNFSIVSLPPIRQVSRASHHRSSTAKDKRQEYGHLHLSGMNSPSLSVKAETVIAIQNDVDSDSQMEVTHLYGQSWSSLGIFEHKQFAESNFTLMETAQIAIDDESEILGHTLPLETAVLTEEDTKVDFEKRSRSRKNRPKKPLGGLGPGRNQLHSSRPGSPNNDIFGNHLLANRASRPKSSTKERPKSGRTPAEGLPLAGRLKLASVARPTTAPAIRRQQLDTTIEDDAQSIQSNMLARPKSSTGTGARGLTGGKVSSSGGDLLGKSDGSRKDSHKDSEMNRKYLQAVFGGTASNDAWV